MSRPLTYIIMASTLTSMPLDSVISQSSLLRADELNNSRRTSGQLRIGSNRAVVKVVFALEENLRFMAVNKYSVFIRFNKSRSKVNKR